MADAIEPKNGIDSRLEWFYARVWSIVCLPKSKNEKSLQNLDVNTAASLKSFHDYLHYSFIFVYPVIDSFTASLELPTMTHVAKKVFVLHRVQQNIFLRPFFSKQNIRDNLMAFDFTKTLLELSNKFLHSSSLSALSNTANQREWSDLISKVLMEKYHFFLSNMHLTESVISSLDTNDSGEKSSDERIKQHCNRVLSVAHEKIRTWAIFQEHLEDIEIGLKLKELESLQHKMGKVREVIGAQRLFKHSLCNHRK